MKLDTLSEVVVPTNEKVEYIYRRTSEGMLVGYLKYHSYDEELLLVDIFVVPQMRGYGIATSMLEELLTTAFDQDLDVMLRVASSGMPNTLDDQDLREWYARHGFKKHARWRQHGVMVTW